MSLTTDAQGVTRIKNVDPDDVGEQDKRTFLLLSGPNHNLFGKRDPKHYGTTTMAQIEEQVTNLGKELGVKVVCAQTNHEGVFIDLIHYSRRYGGIVMNPGAFCHDSYAVRDAIAGVDTPVFEIHISNIEAREEFRKSKTAAVCTGGCLFGAGILGYQLALRALVEKVGSA